MSLEIKSLTNDPPAKDMSLAAPLDSFNIIPTANDVYDLYTAPNTDSTNKKSAIVKSIRLINTHASAAVKLSLYYNKPSASGQYRRRLLAAPDISLPAGYSLIDDAEITLDPGDKIQAKADTAGVIQYVISGVERDVV